MGKNRDRLSIVAAILESANSGASKTRIMFLANLSFNLLEKYLNIAVKAEFIRAEGNKYTLTEQGREFLKQYKHFEDRYVRAQTLIETLSSEREKLALSCLKDKMLNEKRSVIATNRKLAFSP